MKNGKSVEVGSRARAAWVFLGLFALIAGLFLLGSGRSFLEADGLEIGDPAVNALAIHDSIEWQQIHGNYSRFGFSHPGPAFFYWQGGWEWLLCDLTGLAASPIGAHHLGIVVLNSALLALAITLLGGRTGNPAFFPLACTVAAVHFFLINRGLPVSAILSTWPPHVLMVPFAAFIVASGMLAAGSITALPWAIATGSLLVHGHAAHGMFVLPVFAVAAAMWAWTVRNPPWNQPGGRTAVAVSLVVLAIFLIPLVLDLAQGAESNLAAIWQQLRTPSEDRRTWFKVLLYLFSYYGYIPNQEIVIQTLSDKTTLAFKAAAPALAFWAVVHIGLVAYWFRRRRDVEAHAQRATIALIFLALVLTLVWGKAQTGRLENFNAFYVHGLSLAAAWIALSIGMKRAPNSIWIVCGAWATLLVTVALVRPWLTRELGVAREARESIERATEEFVGKDGKVAISFLHVDWPEAAGLILSLVRSGVDARVGEEWQFMFGERHTLAEAEDPDHVLFVQKSGDSGTYAAVFRSHGIRRDLPALSAGINQFGHGGASLLPFHVSGMNIDRPDEEKPGQAITVSRTARLRFLLPEEARGVAVSMHVRSRANPVLPGPQRVIVHWDGREVANLVLDGSSQISFSANFAAEHAGRPVDLRVETPDAWQPRALGLSGDFRRFALALESIVIRVDTAATQER